MENFKIIENYKDETYDLTKEFVEKRKEIDKNWDCQKNKFWEESIIRANKISIILFSLISIFDIFLFLYLKNELNLISIFAIIIVQILSIKFFKLSYKEEYTQEKIYQNIHKDCFDKHKELEKEYNLESKDAYNFERAERFSKILQNNTINDIIKIGDNSISFTNDYALCKNIIDSDTKEFIFIINKDGSLEAHIPSDFRIST